MSTVYFSFSFFLCTSFFASPLSVQSKSMTDDSPSPYLSPSTFFPNYQKMITSFQIYVYGPHHPSSFTSPPESLFFSSLVNSPFLTQTAEEAHLFFVPFPSHPSTRAIARVIRDIRMEFPYWNRTLGADHFYISCAGMGYKSDRNLLELKKNAIQISCFPALSGKFVPHKDMTFPPVASVQTQHAPANWTKTRYGFVKKNAVQESSLADELKKDSDFFIEPEPSDGMTLVERLGSSEFCLFEYGADISGIGDALRFGCVPVVVTDRPIQELPLMDVVAWQEFALFVGSSEGRNGVKRLLGTRCADDACEGMRGLGVVAGQHLVWNEPPQPYDAFHMMMYQLWIRRHAIRYSRWQNDQ